MELTKDIISIATPIIALILACAGLFTWKRQLKGTRDLELSRHILVSLYRVEMLISDIRHPLAIYNLPEGTSPVNKEALNKAYIDYYQPQWAKLSEVMSELQASGIEAKAIWDKSFPESFNPLFKCVRELNDHFNENIQIKLNPEYDSIYTPKEIRDILYARLASPEKDEFGQRIKRAITEIDDKVRQHISPPRNILKFWEWKLLRPNKK